MLSSLERLLDGLGRLYPALCQESGVVVQAVRGVAERNSREFPTQGMGTDHASRDLVEAGNRVPGVPGAQIFEHASELRAGITIKQEDDVGVALSQACLLESALIGCFHPGGQPFHFGTILLTPRSGHVAAGSGGRYRLVHGVRKNRQALRRNGAARRKHREGDSRGGAGQQVGNYSATGVHEISPGVMLDWANGVGKRNYAKIKNNVVTYFVTCSASKALSRAKV